MVKTTEQILENYREHAERSKQGFDSAQTSQNLELAAFNLGQVLKACLMQGLIGWRTDLASPCGAFQDCLEFVGKTYSVCQSMKADCLLEIPLEKTLFIAFVLHESPVRFDFHELVADRCLDAILGYGLLDKWDHEAWTCALDQLRRMKGTALAVDSYTTYHQLLHSALGDPKPLVERAISLFAKRKSNAFYSGGEQTDGGGPYNAITVDYRLAAIMKKIGYDSDSVHSWRW